MFSNVDKAVVASVINMVSLILMNFFGVELSADFQSAAIIVVMGLIQFWGTWRTPNKEPNP
jgi:hypothetical protein